MAAIAGEGKGGDVDRERHCSAAPFDGNTAWGDVDGIHWGETTRYAMTTLHGETLMGRDFVH